MSAIRNLYSNCCSRGYKITKLGKYCKYVPVYIAVESVFKLLVKISPRVSQKRLRFGDDVGKREFIKFAKKYHQ